MNARAHAQSSCHAQSFGSFNLQPMGWRVEDHCSKLCTRIENRKNRDWRRAENPILIQSRSQAFGSIRVLAGKKTEQGQRNDLQIEG